MTWKDILATASTTQTLQRAQSMLNHQIIYKLGDGPTDPTQPITTTCDCSGFVDWSIGLPRELPHGSGKWIYTDSIWAGGAPVKVGMFTPIGITDAQIGDLLVYPHSGVPQHMHAGHIGIITEVTNQMPTKVIHCSLGNYNHFHDAIKITEPSVFLNTNHPTRAMRIEYDVLKTFI